MLKTRYHREDPVFSTTFPSSEIFTSAFVFSLQVRGDFSLGLVVNRQFCFEPNFFVRAFSSASSFIVSIGSAFVKPGFSIPAYRSRVWAIGFPTFFRARSFSPDEPEKVDSVDSAEMKFWEERKMGLEKYLKEIRGNWKYVPQFEVDNREDDSYDDGEKKYKENKEKTHKFKY